MPNHLFLVTELASVGMTLVRHLVAVPSVLAPVKAPVAVVKGKRFRLIGILKTGGGEYQHIFSA